MVLGFLDLFVYAHHKHRLDFANAGNFGDCLTGRVRFMTAITLAYAHAYQAICLLCTLLASRTTPSGFPCPSPGVHSFQMIVLLQVKKAMIFMCKQFIQMVAHLCFVWSRHYHRSSSCFSGATIHSNNTDEMTAIFEALSFLGPRGLVTQYEQSCIYYVSMRAACICLGTFQARAHVQLVLACQLDPCST